MKLDDSMSAETRQKWKVVRRDDFTDVPGFIVMADEDSGVCRMLVGAEEKRFDFGPEGIRLVGRAR